MPDGMVENQKFDSPLLTPTTKADVGHDEDISREDVVTRASLRGRLCKLEEYTRALFQRGTN